MRMTSLAPRSEDEYVRWLSRQSKAELRRMVERWARANGHAWALGGPEAWSHDELVSGCLRIYRGQEP